jgi:membrane protein
VTPERNRTEEELAELRDEVVDTEETIEGDTSALLDRHRRIGVVVRLLQAVMREQTQEQVGLAASGAAFWLIISSFPTAIAAVSIFGLIVSPAGVANDLAGLTKAGPSSLGSIATDQLQRVAAGDHVGVSVGLGVSLVLALWSASAGIYNLERAIRTAYGLRPERYVDARGRAFLGAFATLIALGLLALISTALSGVLSDVPAAIGALVGIPVLMLFVAGLIAGLYRFSIARTVGFRAILPGSIASASGLAIVAVGFSTYLRFSTRFTAVYGALAGAVIAMIGTYLAVYVVLLGAVLNVQLTGRVAHELDDEDDGPLP